jgi:hypothetical protein
MDETRDIGAAALSSSLVLDLIESEHLLINRNLSARLPARPSMLAGTVVGFR